MQQSQARPLFQRQQISSDLLWGMTQNYNSYLYTSRGHTFSRDPLNLSGLNLRRDSGIVGNAALGIDYTVSTRKIRSKKVKKEGQVVRVNLRVKSKRLMQRRNLVAKTPLTKQGVPIHNRSVYVQQRNLTTRAAVKVITRGLTNYRRDLVPLAIRRLRTIYRFKRVNKANNRREAKATTATK
jgi:hypothetical protein